MLPSKQSGSRGTKDDKGTDAKDSASLVEYIYLYMTDWQKAAVGAAARDAAG